MTYLGTKAGEQKLLGRYSVHAIFRSGTQQSRWITADYIRSSASGSLCMAWFWKAYTLGTIVANAGVFGEKTISIQSDASPRVRERPGNPEGQVALERRLGSASKGWICLILGRTIL